MARDASIDMVNWKQVLEPWSPHAILAHYELDRIMEYGSIFITVKVKINLLQSG